MVNALTVQIVYYDSDIYELRLRASNGDLSGNVLVYVGIGELKVASGKLAGFPKSLDDKLLIEFGTFLPGYAGGGARLDFRCVDNAGHVQLRLKMQTEPNQDVPPQSVSFILPIEPAAIDVFVDELKAMEEDLEVTATLRVF